MADGDQVEATMKDLKDITSLTSIMDKRMDELRDLLAKLAGSQASTPSASSVPGATLRRNPPRKTKERKGIKGIVRRMKVKMKMIFLRKLHPPKGKMVRRRTILFVLSTLPVHLFPTLI